jgi:hypothetical protein
MRQHIYLFHRHIFTFSKTIFDHGHKSQTTTIQNVRVIDPQIKSEYFCGNVKVINNSQQVTHS